MIPRFVVTAALGLSVIATSQNAHAQGQVEIGRFQVSINERANTAVLVDSITGRSWILTGSNERRWHELSFGETAGQAMLTPLACTQDNPTCYFPLAKTINKSPDAQKPAEGEKVH